jgi:N-acetylmuramoyl-L-alanine amidase
MIAPHPNPLPIGWSEGEDFNWLDFVLAIWRMRASMRRIIALGILLLALPIFGAARNPYPPPPARPTGSVFLRDWADKHGFVLNYDPKTLSISVTNRWADLAFSRDSRRGTINGIGVWLSFPIDVYGGHLIVNRKDLDTLIEPALYPKRLGKDRKIRIVAIDAGHGGKDPGFQIGNHQEKKYALLLAKEVQDQLNDAGVKAFMTRRTDTYVERPDRASTAGKAKADLFVSLHFNAAPDVSARGIETYAVTPFGAEATNGSEMTLRSYPGNRYDAQSVLLAYEVQRSIVHSLDVVDRGVRRAGLEVLRKAAMPGILIEGGFMSNSADAKQIFDEAHRRELARAIVDGILAYKRIMERTTPLK